MESAPGETPEDAHEDEDPRAEPLAFALGQLNPVEMRVIELTVMRGLSVRNCAAEMGVPKTNVHRVQEQALAKLRALLKDNPTIQARLRPDDIDHESDDV